MNHLCYFVLVMVGIIIILIILSLMLNLLKIIFSRKNVLFFNKLTAVNNHVLFIMGVCWVILMAGSVVGSIVGVCVYIIRATQQYLPEIADMLLVCMQSYS